MPPSLTAVNVNQSYLSNLEQQIQSTIAGSGFKTTKTPIQIIREVKRKASTANLTG